MAVAETSCSSGKSCASGTTRSTRAQRTRRPHPAELQASNWHVALTSIGRAATNSIAISTTKPRTGDISNSTVNATVGGNLAGRIEGKAVALNATQDIENMGGAIIAQQSLSANAGRDIKVQTTTLESRSAAAAPAAAPVTSSGALLGATSSSASSGKLQTRSTDISRVAGLYVTGEAGTLLASAGRDAELMGALLQSAGTIARFLID